MLCFTQAVMGALNHMFPLTRITPRCVTLHSAKDNPKTSKIECKIRRGKLCQIGDDVCQPCKVATDLQKQQPLLLGSCIGQVHAQPAEPSLDGSGQQHQLMVHCCLPTLCTSCCQYSRNLHITSNFSREPLSGQRGCQGICAPIPLGSGWDGKHCHHKSAWQLSQIEICMKPQRICLTARP